MKVPAFGLEYELEQTNHGYATPEWRTERDNSLRDNGIEFVLRGKLGMSEALTAARNLVQSIGDNYEISHRCSTHIHVDAQGLKGWSKVAMLLGLIIHDEWFFSHTEGRESNNFCAPVLYSPSAIHAINRACRAYDYDEDGDPAPWGNRQVPILNGGDSKYMAINTECMNLWGSIELRHFNPIMDTAVLDAILTKVSEIYKVASSVPTAGRLQAASVWDSYREELPNEVQWVQEIYNTHNKMVGL